MQIRDITFDSYSTISCISDQDMGERDSMLGLVRERKGHQEMRYNE